jgi:hypothetical protein
LIGDYQNIGTVGLTRNNLRSFPQNSELILELFVEIICSATVITLSLAPPQMLRNSTRVPLKTSENRLLKREHPTFPESTQNAQILLKGAGKRLRHTTS